MSWQGYIDNLMETKKMTAVGIFGLDSSPWAASSGFPLSPENIRQVIASISDSSKMSNGLTVGSERYILVRNDPGVTLMLKKGPSGLVAHKSTQCVFIALHDETTKAEITLTHVGKVVDYLSKHGY